MDRKVFMVYATILAGDSRCDAGHIFTMNVHKDVVASRVNV